MNQQIKTILQLSNKLERPERWMLVQYLLETIRKEEQGIDLSTEWEAELDRRETLIQSGDTEFYSWEEVQKELKRD